MAVIGDLRRLVHLGADTVADVFPDDGVAVTLHVLLDGCRDIEQPVALLGEPDPLKKALSGHVDQILRLRGDPAAGEGGRTVAVKPSNVRSHIHTDDIALLEDPGSGNSVDDLVVDADAGAGRIAVVMQEGGDCALLANEMLHCTVDLMGCDAGLYQFPCISTGSRGNFSGPAHQFDLMGGFECNHTLISPVRGGWPGRSLPQRADSPQASGVPAGHRSPSAARSPYDRPRAAP